MESAVYQGDALKVLKSFEPESIDCVFTSPSPFGQGDKNGGIGSEEISYTYNSSLVDLFIQVYRVLKPTGCLWLQLQDNHDESGNMMFIPELLIMRMVLYNPWILRSKCIWVRTEKFEYQEDYNRFARDWEYLYFFTKSKDHYFNNPRNKVQSSVFYADYHEPRKNEFESGFPEKIIERCINLSCPPNGIILDPLADSGTTGVVAKRMNRKFVMIELSYEKALAIRARLGL